MIWLVRISDKGPVFDFFHSSKASARSVELARTLVVETCQPPKELERVVKTHFTPVSFAAKSNVR
jgi:hypothetical protein